MENYKIEIKWAFIFIFMMLLWVYIEKAFGWHDEFIAKQLLYTNLVAIPSITVYVLALLDKKKNYYSGIMNYKEAVISGMVITVIVTIFTPLTQYISSTFISPEYFTNIINYVVEVGNMTQANAETYFSSKSYILQALVGSLSMGTLTTVIVAYFIKSKEAKKKALIKI